MHTEFAVLPRPSSLNVPAPSPDFPAAHSMDTTWFAVDVNGELGLFDTASEGAAPVLLGMDANSPAAVDCPDVVYRHQYQAAVQRCGRGTGRFHCYRTSSEGQNYFFLEKSPSTPLTIEQIPTELRTERHLLFLRDYDFASREPVRPFDHWPSWFLYRGGEDIYPRYSEEISLPASSLPLVWSEVQFVAAAETGTPETKYFFAVDDAGELAVFDSDGLGAVPLHVSAYQCRDAWGKLAESQDSPCEQLRVMNSVPPEERHWLEYPWLPLSPRELGFHHFGAFWHYAVPYLRFASPRIPIQASQLPPELLQSLKPVHFPGIVFRETTWVQPFEFVPCRSARQNDFGWAHAVSPVWINASWTQVHPTHPFSIFTGDPDLLLRRARHYVEGIQSLKHARR